LVHYATVIENTPTHAPLQQGKHVEWSEWCPYCALREGGKK